MTGLFWRRWTQVVKQLTSPGISQKNRWGFLSGIFVLALIVGTLGLFFSRPSNDDFSFFHRAIVQLQHLDQPFFTNDTAHNLPGLPPLSNTHIMTSYEPLVAMTANVIGVNPLVIYHYMSAFIAEIILIVVYILLYKEFRLTNWQSFTATLLACIFLFIDGNLNRSFGNIVFLTLWLGKTILWGLWMPMTLLVSHRFLSYPTLRNLYLVAMVSIGAVGLSGSGIFMIPILLCGISLAYLLSYGFSSTHLKRALLLNCASFYSIAIAIALLSDIIPQPFDTSVWNQGWPSGWWQNLWLVIGDSATLTRNVLILLVLPFMSLRKPLNRFPVMLTGVLCLIFANPLLGPVWVKMLKPGAYWRLAYLFSLAWCAGLIINLVIWRSSLRVRLIRLGFATIIIIATIHAYQFSILTPDESKASIKFKVPWELKFPTAELTFVRPILKHLSNRNLLAPENMVVVAGLLDPTIRFEATRGADTLHIFRNAGKDDEGLRRIAAQRFVSTCADLNTSDDKAPFLQSVEMGVNAVILQKCNPDLSLNLIKRIGLDKEQWSEVKRNNGYILLLRDR